MNAPPPAVALPVGTTLARAVALAAREFGALHVVTFVMCLPSGWLEWRDARLLAAGASERLTPLWLMLPVALATETVLQGMASGLALRRIGGAPARVREAFSLHGARLAALLAIAACTALVTFAGVGWTSAMWLAEPGFATGALFGGGAVLTLLWVAATLPAVPVVLAERLGPLRALARAFALTAGVRGRAFLLRLVQAAAIVFAARFGAIAGSGLGQEAALFGGFAVRVVATALLGMVPAVVYLTLRAARGEPPLTALEEIFT